MPLNGAYTLADCTEPMLALVCRKCDRAGRYKVARLIAEHGADMKLPELRHMLAKCPRTLLNQRPRSESDPCGVEYAKPIGGDASRVTPA
jgi:hypothetical protein